MSSSQKTKFLKLNKWQPSDKPKRDDFNIDNELIDNVFGDLSEKYNEFKSYQCKTNNSETEKDFFTTGFYEGDNANSRIINLGFNSKCIFVYTVGESIINYHSISGNNEIRAAIMVDGKSSIGIEPVNNGFKVINANSVSPAAKTPYLNMKQKIYVYIALK